MRECVLYLVLYIYWRRLFWSFIRLFSLLVWTEKVMEAERFLSKVAIIRLLLLHTHTRSISVGKRAEAVAKTSPNVGGIEKKRGLASQGVDSHALLNSLCADKTDQKASIRELNEPAIEGGVRRQSVRLDGN